MKNYSIYLQIISILLLTLATSCKKQGGPVENPPTIFVNFSFESNNGYRAPTEISFTNLSEIPAEAGTPEYLWNFGDGSATSAVATPAPHVYTEVGDYMVTLEISTPNLGTKKASIPLSILPSYEVVFAENFEGHNPMPDIGADLPASWVVIDNDNGIPKNADFYTKAWKIKSSDFFDSDIAVATSYYQNTPLPNADDWMISPEIELTGAIRYTLHWEAMSLTRSGNWPDSYQVYISNTTQDIAGCVDNGKLLKEVINESWSSNATDKPGNGKQQHSIDISSYADETVHIGFRLMTPAPGGSELGIDSVVVYRHFSKK